MLAFFLAGTLWLGLRYKKDSRNITEYTVGNKTFSTAALIATVVATSYGGGVLIRTVETIYTNGLQYIILLIGSVMICNLSRIIVSRRIGTLMEKYIPSKGHISIASTIGYIYGKTPRIITALASVGASAASVAIQVTVTSRALQICISDVNPAILMVCSASIVVLYSALGGIRSVVITDIFQCAIFTIMVPYIAYKIFRHTGMAILEIFKSLSESEKFQIAPIFHDITNILSLIASCLAQIRVSPASVQRMYMARNSQQAQKVQYISAIINVIIALVIVCSGVTICIGYSSIPNPSMIWPTIVNDSPDIFKGFLIISLFAMAMSTADSRLNAASSMFVHDLIEPLRRKKTTDQQQLYLAKVTCFAIGILAILLALYTSRYKNALLRLFLLATDISNPTFIPPFLLAIWGFRCREKTAVWGMVAGVVTITIWKKYIPDINGSFVAMLVNGITMLILSKTKHKNRLNT